MVSLGGDRYQLTLTRNLPQGVNFDDARLTRLDVCDSAFNKSLFEVDSDGDGAADAFDAFPENHSEFTDTDGDGIGNNTDTDDDGDGVEDASDAFPSMRQRRRMPTVMV